MKLNKKIAITTGDVNGIGAEITIKALDSLKLPKENVVIISNSNILDFYEESFPRPLRERVRVRGNYDVIEIPFNSEDLEPGKLSAQSGEFCFQALKKACEMAKSGEIDAIVTAPVSKEALHLAGHKFNGQTEVLEYFLAHDNQHAEMLFVAKDFRVLLLTRHVALKDINLNKNEVIDKISRLDEFFKTKLKISNPKFALCALNPHAGEGGILGSEEIEILQPAVNELRAKGVDITNPMPADTLFINAAKDYFKQERECRILSKSLPSSPPDLMPSCYIACYHDQGLIPIKTIASEKTVNMTIGLDVIRTSPCHGTAFDIAGKNIASEDSMIEAILQASL